VFGLLASGGAPTMGTGHIFLHDGWSGLDCSAIGYYLLLSAFS
jgi:hypothetical protein